MPQITQRAGRNGLRTRSRGQTGRQDASGDKTRAVNGGRARNGAIQARERILNAATLLFTRRGFSATRTREIANAARVNEALVFYYFGGKQNLYWTVLWEKLQSTHFVESLREKLSSGRADKELFAQLAAELLHANESKDGLLRLLLFTGLGGGEPFRSLSARAFKKYLNQAYGTLAKFVRERIREGTFREVDPELAARAFFSLASYHVTIQEFLGGKYFKTFPERRVTQTIADLWLESLRKK